MSGGILNPASMKQALVEGAVRIPGINLYEQGAGKMNLLNSMVRFRRRLVFVIIWTLYFFRAHDVIHEPLATVGLANQPTPTWKIEDLTLT